MAEPGSRRFRLALAVLFAGAMAVRVLGLTWDQGHNFHPDERRIVEAVQQLSFSPLQLDPKFYAYGSFPFYVTRAACSLLGNVSSWFLSWDGILLTGRVLSAAWGSLACVLLALLGRRLFGERAGLLAGLLLAGAVFHVQNSHFATNDAPLTTLILATLLLLARAVDRGTAGAHLLAGVAAGLAVATKVSAATLLLPLCLAPLLLFARTRRVSGFAGAAAGAFLGLVAGYLAGQPYAILAWRDVLAGVGEQARMVRSAGSVPYTNQYLGVPKVVYDLRELVVWGLGPALGLAALAGVAGRLRSLLRERDPREALLWAWAVPFFVVTASFDVKFPRYLLPLYPALLLSAGWLLAGNEGGGRLCTLARRTVLALSGVYLLAFLSIYTRPHTIVAASEWFHENVAPGARVLVQDWDEGFPFSLPDRPAGRFRVASLSFYAPDGPSKTRTLAAQLSSGDVLVLQTKRLYGAVTQASGKFPDTDRLFRLLFSGDLGYTLVRTFSSPPQLFGAKLPTELADESFSVYDHPKAVVFRNAGRLGARELERILREGTPSRRLSRSQILRARPDDPSADSSERISGTRSSLLALALWAALLQGLGWAAWRLLGPRLPALPGTYGLAKLAGVTLFGALAFVLVSWGPFSFVPSLAFAVVALVLLAGAFPGRPAVAVPRGERVRTELVFWGTFAAFAAIRAYSPEIFWGEKPMDFAILNALIRSDGLPPPEPWFSGTTLSYTYFGHFLVAAFAKALGVHPALAFNLGIAATAALTATGLLCAGAFLGGRLRTGAYAVLLGLGAGNLAGLVELARRKSVDFDSFWAVSRVLKGQNEINEFPLWSFLFADLHAHVLGFPFLLGLLAVLLLIARRRSSHDVYVPPFSRTIQLLLAALFLGALAITNGWSVPTAGGLVLLLFTVSAVASAPGPARSLSVRNAGRLLVGSIAPAAIVATTAALWTLPFWRSFRPPPLRTGWEEGPFFDPFSFGLVHGLAIALVAPFLLLLFRRTVRDPERPRRLAGVLVAATVSLLALSLVSVPALRAGRLAPAPSIRVFVFGLAALGLALAFSSRLSPVERAAPALAACAFLIVGGCELVWVWDRMNTVFKLGLDAMLLLAVAGAAALDALLAPAPWRRPARALWRLVAALAGLAALATSALALVGHLRTHRVETPRWTLDGTAFRSSHRPDEAAAVRWIEKNVPGAPVLAEAYGPSYQEYSRFSMDTGLPIVLGWDYHLVQRGKARADIQRRVVDLRTLYSVGSPDAIGEVLSRYGIRFLVSGIEERIAYGSMHGAAFRSLPGLLSPAFSQGGVQLYRVLLGPGLAAAPGSGPAAARAEAPRTEQGPPSEVTGLGEPRGLAVAPDGHVWVADYGHDRVVRLTRTLSDPAPFGRKGTGRLEFSQPSALAIGPSGDVFVADTGNGRVQVLAPDGSFRRELASGFEGPRGIAVDVKGRVFVSDTGRHRIVRLSPDGAAETEWGGRGGGPGQLSDPMGIAVDRDGTVYVCDNGNARLSLFSSDGKPISQVRVPGWTSAAYSEPAVLVADSGTAWVTVPLAREVRLLTTAGATLEVFRASPALGMPIGIAMPPPFTRLLVSDRDAKGLVWLRPLPRGQR